MKKNERKALKESILAAIKLKLKENNARVTDKFEKSVRKSIKQIVKKAQNLKKATVAKNSPKLKKLQKKRTPLVAKK